MSKAKIGELIDSGIITAHKDGNYGSLYPRTSEFGDKGVPFLTAKNVSDDGRIDFSRASRLNHQKASQFGFGWIEKDDVLLSHNATVGRVALVPEIPEKMLVGTSLTYFRLDKARLLPSYFATYLASKEFQDQLASVMSYSTRNQVPITIQRDLYVDIPRLADQKFIGKVFETFSRKIELNRKTNETLEGIAKALFKSWFVDFDPVRAKSEGRPTGLPDEISELFPDSFEETELSEIPSGWKISSVKEQSSYLSRGISPNYCHDGEGVVVLNQKCIRGGAVDFSKSRWHNPTKKKIEGRTLSKFDCLVNSTGVGTLGRVAIVPELGRGDVIVDSHVTIVRGHDEQSSFYLANTLLSRQSEIEALGEGSTGQTELSKGVLGEMELVVPPKELLNAYYSSTVCLFEKSWSNEATSRTLASLRDSLLPRLITGELRVPDAEKMLKEVGI